MSTVRFLAAELAIDGCLMGWSESAPDWEWTLFDDLRSLFDWLDFQSFAGGDFGPREFRVVTRGHLLLPAGLAGVSGAYLSPDVLAEGRWRWHSPRVFVARTVPVPPVLRAVR